MSSADVFDAQNLDTYTPQAAQKLRAVEILDGTNKVKPNAIRFDKISSARLADAKRDLVLCLAVGFANVRRAHDDNILARTSMFGNEDDPMSQLRPSVGLKRTFMPRITIPYDRSQSNLSGISVDP